MRLFGLLAVRVEGIEIIPGLYADVIVFSKIFADIIFKRQITAFVVAQIVVIEKDVTDLIDSRKVQYQFLTLLQKAVRQSEPLVVFQQIFMFLIGLAA